MRPLCFSSVRSSVSSASRAACAGLPDVHRLTLLHLTTSVFSGRLIVLFRRRHQRVVICLQDFPSFSALFSSFWRAVYLSSGSAGVHMPSAPLRCTSAVRPRFSPIPCRHFAGFFQVCLQCAAERPRRAFSRSSHAPRRLEDTLTFFRAGYCDSDTIAIFFRLIECLLCLIQHFCR